MIQKNTLQYLANRDTLKQYDPSGQFLIPNKPNDVDTEWIVQPDFLTLTGQYQT